MNEKYYDDEYDKSEDFWSLESFEDKITRATIALYEKNFINDSLTFNRVSLKDFNKIKKFGVFIPNPNRLVHKCYIDGIDGIPQTACVSICDDSKTIKRNDESDSYFRMEYFNRIDKLPNTIRQINNGICYELISLFPKENGPVLVVKVYFVLEDGFTYMQFPESFYQYSGKYPNYKPPIIRNFLKEQNMEMIERIQDTMAQVIQIYADSRHTWTISAINDVSKVSVGSYAETVKSLLYARNYPMTASGRKRPILHLVGAHKRRIKEGTDINIQEFLRGVHQVVMDDTLFVVRPPLKVLEELERNRK